MKIALAHELLTMKGGAERVLRIAADMFPEAPVYTLLYDEKKLGDWFPAHRVVSATLPLPYSLLPAPYRLNHHLHLRHFPRAVEQWDFSQYDVVLSFSSAFMHGIITNRAPRHVCYVHSPARYLWDRTHDVLDRAGHGMLGAIRRQYMERTFHRLRIWDAETAARPDKLLAASREVQRRIQLYWRRDAEVVYPPINEEWLTTPHSPLPTPNPNPNPNPTPYFFIASTLVPYKRIDLAIHACNALKLPLKIAGEGPERRRLEQISGPTIAFLGHQIAAQLRELYTNAKATIFPGDEDFGLVPLESMACGTPVIAYGSGGALETVIEGKTGTFFGEPTADSLQKKLKEFDQNLYTKENGQKQARCFGETKFRQKITHALEAVLR
jgi:glycosyltransferase involved in cell wall biosynthesis